MQIVIDSSLQLYTIGSMIIAKGSIRKLLFFLLLVCAGFRLHGANSRFSLDAYGTAAIKDSTELATYGFGGGFQGDIPLISAGNGLALLASVSGRVLYLLPEDSRMDRMLDAQGAVGVGILLPLPFGSLSLYGRYLALAHIVRGTWTGAMKEELFLDHAGEGALMLEFHSGKRGSLGFRMGGSVAYLVETGDIWAGFSAGFVVQP